MSGRPSTYDRDTAEAILRAMIENSASVAQACARVQTEAFPNGVAEGTFHGWVVDNRDAEREGGGLSERYERARKVRAWQLVEEIPEIADDSSQDFAEDDKGNVRFNKEAVQRSALRVSSRQWFAGKVLRNEFGEKVQVAGAIAVNVGAASASLAAKLGAVDPAGGAQGAAEGGAGSGKAD